MLRPLIITLSLCMPAAATAGCANPEAQFMSCTFNGGKKRLETCYDKSQASYWFGRKNGKAELALTAREGEFRHTPWPGIGSSIWEELIFVSNGVTYTVYAVLVRDFPEEDDGEVTVVAEGGIVVSQNGKELAELQCDAGSVNYGY